MVLGGDIVQALWSAVHRCQNSFEVNNLNGSYYFSTHGCSLVLSSIEVGLLEDEAPLDAAAAARALLLKKFDILAMDGDATDLNRSEPLVYARSWRDFKHLNPFNASFRSNSGCSVCCCDRSFDDPNPVGNYSFLHQEFLLYTSSSRFSPATRPHTHIHLFFQLQTLIFLHT